MIFSANFNHVGALSEGSKCGKSDKCLHIPKTEKIAKFLRFPFVRIVKYLEFEYNFWKN
jgi:hypothetical protein